MGDGGHAQARFVNLFDNLKVQLQPIDNCLEQLGYLLAGGDSTPAVVGVRAYELKEGKAEDGQQVKKRPRLFLYTVFKASTCYGIP